MAPWNGCGWRWAWPWAPGWRAERDGPRARCASRVDPRQDRKSTRLNSSHSQISYAVFCLKKKKKLDRLFSRLNPRKDQKDNPTPSSETNGEQTETSEPTTSEATEPTEETPAAIKESNTTPPTN